MKIINEYNNRGITITTIKRSGSSYLKHLYKHLLDNPVGFKEGRHRFKNDTFRDFFEEILKNYYNNDFRSFQNYICKTFAPHIGRYKEIYYIPGSYNVFLIRRNFLEGVLSQTYSQYTNIYGYEIGEKKPKKINVPLDLFKQNITTRKNEIGLLLKNKAKIIFDAFIEYEDLSFIINNDLKLLNIKKNENVIYGTLSMPPKEELIENLDELKLYYFENEHTIKISNTILKDGIITDYNVQHQ